MSICNVTRKVKLLAASIVVAVLLVPAVGMAAEQVVKKAELTAVPVVTLKDWQNSSDPERYSFLLGFITMLDMEKEWQGKSPLAFEKSLVNSWVKGLDGITLENMNKELLTYISANPDKLSRPLVEVLWFEYVQPKLDQAQKDSLSKQATKKGKK